MFGFQQGVPEIELGGVEGEGEVSDRCCFGRVESAEASDRRRRRHCEDSRSCSRRPDLASERDLGR